MYAIVIPVTDKPHTVDLPDNEDAHLDIFQGLVGGYIEGVPLTDDGLVAYCNEEGKVHGLPSNHQAMSLLRPLGLDLSRGDILAGQVVVAGYSAMGETTSPSDKAAGALGVTVPTTNA